MKDLTREEANEWVHATATEVTHLIDRRLASINKSQCWALKGRLINMMFMMHYQMSYRVAENALEKGKQPQPPGETL
jgi:hypothetical protein